MRGRTKHSSGHGDVLSPRASTASRMTLQCPRWRRGGGDGRTGLMVTEGTRPTSRHGPVRARNGRPSPFEGSTVLFRGCSALAVQEWVAQCRRADTGLTAQYRTVAGMASPRGLAEQRRDLTPRHIRGTARICKCQSIKWLDRGSRYGGGVSAGPSGEVDLTRGGVSPQARRDLARGGAQPSSKANLARGGAQPSSEAEFG
jgi:hypothetical protein